MTSLSAAIKMCLLVVALLVIVQPVANGAPLTIGRGVNLDIWTTWPNEDRWHDPDVLLPFPEWRRSIGEAELAALKRAGFDFVRMPVDPSPFLSPATAQFRDRLFADVLAAARLVTKSGLKLIVDLHLFPAGSNRVIGMAEVMEQPELFDRYAELVGQMARLVAGEEPGQLALELMNEPVIDCEAGSREWPDRLSRLVAEARAQAPAHTLVLSGGCWGSADGLAALDPAVIGDDNVIWTFHSYEPFLLTHQGALWAGDFVRYVTGLPYPPEALAEEERQAVLDQIRARIRAQAPFLRRAGMLAYLDEQVARLDTIEKVHAVMAAPFALVAGWAEEHGIDRERILLGEFGMIRQEYGNDFVMPAAWRADYVGDMAGLAEAHGFAWSVWSYSGAFGIVDSFDGRKAEPGVAERIGALR